MASAHETTVREVYEAADRRDMDGILAGAHSEIEIRPVLGANPGADVYNGHVGVRQWTRDLWAEWETFERCRRGHRARRPDPLPGPYPGIGPRQRRPIETEIFHLTTLRDGLILRIEGHVDRDSAVRALEAT